MRYTKPGAYNMQFLKEKTLLLQWRFLIQKTPCGGFRRPQAEYDLFFREIGQGKPYFFHTLSMSNQGVIR